MKDLKRLWLVSLLVKFILAAIIPLAADEAYYWVWSNRLQLSYFDHPPMVAWLFYLGHFLEPFLNSVRWPAVFLGHCSLALGVLLLKDSFSEEKIRWWMFLILFSPLLGFGSLIVTPDLPVIFFWILSLYFLKKVFETGGAWNYLALGSSLGLGFCSKYHIVLFVPCLILYLLFEKKWTLVQWKWVPLTILAGFIFCFPVLYWNYLNDFSSFTFQIKHGLQKENYDFAWTSSYVFGQILILFPWIVWAAIKAKVPEKMRFLIYFAWFPLIFFFFTSFRASVEANWPIIAVPSVCALSACHPKIRSWLRYYVGFWGVAITIVLTALFVPSLRQMNSKINEPFEFQQLSAQTQDYSPLYAASYQMASSLWYFSKKPVFKLQGLSRYDFFDTLKESKPEGSVFYLVKHETNGLPEWISQQQWSQREIKKISPDYVLLEFTRR
ncbi:MAG TPA: glycosyltransferase family 39 protein [Bdellovibrio sp.]|nr:glycosyltransferase family 39 protein [Bdellovibrio sp.]